MHETDPLPATAAQRVSPVPDARDRAPSHAFTVATFNVHAGIDGWGRPYDVMPACRALDADVLVLEETWTGEGTRGIAGEVADAMGYSVFEQPLAAGRRAGPDEAAHGRWKRRFDWRGASHAIYLDSEHPMPERIRSTPRYIGAERGRWGVAVLTRLPAERQWVIDLGRLDRDRARRAAVAVDLRVGGHRVTVVGTHMSHLTYGAPLQLVRLHRGIRAPAGPGPIVLAGDMNLWGPPVSAFFPGWRRTFKAKTWPAWRPHSQLDHVLVRGGITVVDGAVLWTAGSDHLPLRVRLAVE